MHKQLMILMCVLVWWLDGTDAAKEGKWLWQYNQSPIKFTDWYLGKPTNNNPTANCLLFWEIDGWRWSDAACPTLLRYICQAKP
ncbi:hypothetical protein CHUAL_002658 [Chamberlinius hualienensis]